jgi:hypothetical protein
VCALCAGNQRRQIECAQLSAVALNQSMSTNGPILFKIHFSRQGTDWEKSFVFAILTDYTL